MCEFVINRRLCKIPSKGPLCHVHQRSSKLAKKTLEQAKEITILNAKLSEATRKLRIIDECDRVKCELAPISINCSFRQAITNSLHSDYIEKVFGAPYAECIHIYDELLTKRNMLVHRHTNKLWDEQHHKKRTHNKSLKQLIKSIKTYQI